MIELRLFGSLELKKSDGEEVRPVLVQPKRAALLCYLNIAVGFGNLMSLVPARRDHLGKALALNQLHRIVVHTALTADRKHLGS